ncbi:MAG: sialate O-acetylesterase [Capsulimonadaceae bacterium]|nr:sialate O-acetylesterase [Capsulimonadaceae bacterium]
MPHAFVLGMLAVSLFLVGSATSADSLAAQPNASAASNAAPSGPPPPVPPQPVVAPPLPAALALTVASPREYQVFQRQTEYQGSVRVSGTVASGKFVDVRLSGHPLKGDLGSRWRRLPVDGSTHSFYDEIPTPAGGWYRIELRATAPGLADENVTIEHVGVGEVFVGAGQSNSTSYGKIKTQPQSGMVSSFTGHEWKIADDPQDGSHDEHWWKARGGSFWPSLGDALYAHYHVPIGVAVTGNGGTKIEQWLPEAPIGLFAFTMTRVAQLGPRGFRALLWHQGESDYNTPSEEYAAGLAHIIQTSRLQAGWAFPWFVAQASYNAPNVPFSKLPRDGQKRIWDLGLALPGPDTDTLIGDYREPEGAHMTPKGLKEHGELWAKVIETYLDPLLAAGKR